MEKQIYLRIALISIALTNLFIAGCYPYSCPSPPVMYAAEGGNVTLCWRLIPSLANTTDLKRFTIMALKRPDEADMNKVASAKTDGTFSGWYKLNHDGLYANRVNVVANLTKGILFFKLTNYTSKIENVYCVLYEMSGIDDVSTCHSQAILLRTAGSEIVRSTVGPVESTAVESTLATITNTTENTQKPQHAQPGTESPRVAPPQYKTSLIIVTCLLGVVSILAIVGFALFYQLKKRSLQPYISVCKADDPKL